jgi:peroxisomal 3,2-trans-enoyl-CoA isomerase
LALYDRVFAVETCTFTAPLVKLAQGPEMASSYTFPKIFGQIRAEELIIGGKEISTKELAKFNFLSCYTNAEEANKALQAHLQELDQLDWASYMEARRLMRLPDKENLLIANELELDNLIQRWCNPELPSFIAQTLSAMKQKPKL